jgi:cupin fold WbuC family metalloprotein
MSAVTQRLRRHSEEVVFATTPLVRLCAHQDVQELVHEMFIVHERDAYVRPHRHRACESFHLIEGRADVILFDERGGIAEVIQLGEYGSGDPFYYRLAQPSYHTLIVRTPVVVFHESKQGPFISTEAEFASWAPDGQDPAAARAFIAALSIAVERFRTR